MRSAAAPAAAFSPAVPAPAKSVLILRSFWRSRASAEFSPVMAPVQCEIAKKVGIDIAAIEKHIHDGAAFASLAADYQVAEKMRIEGSPSFVLNEGRQKLYGNVGFRLMEANIQELLRLPRSDEASWC
jgi:protein-disulfide isomerase